MPLSPASSIVIDLLLLSDAVAEEKRAEALHLANKLAHTAAENGHMSIAQLASAVFDLASGGAPWRSVGHEASRLLVEAEGVLHAANGPAERRRTMGRSPLRH